uniref:Uncharacterized protein n=1 Tax=Cacopsylla melanoneura TaxID=428564 RepID=A0A8D8YVI7_9HEMI
MMMMTVVPNLRRRVKRKNTTLAIRTRKRVGFWSTIWAPLTWSSLKKRDERKGSESSRSLPTLKRKILPITVEVFGVKSERNTMILVIKRTAVFRKKISVPV